MRLVALFASPGAGCGLRVALFCCHNCGVAGRAIVNHHCFQQSRSFDVQPWRGMCGVDGLVASRQRPKPCGGERIILGKLR